MTIATGFSGSVSGVKDLLTTVPTACRRHPFLKDQPVMLSSVGSATVYGVNHSGDGKTTQYAKFTQTVTGNKAFKLPTAVNAPNQTNGAVAAADQLRTVVLLNGTPVMHSNDAAVAAASSYCIGMGGGTAVGGVAISIKGTTAANLLAGSALMSLAAAGADTETLLVGDILSIAGDSTVYRVTGTTYSMNGTTEVNVAITPPLQQAVLAGAVVTPTTSDDRTILFATAPAVNDVIEVMVFAAADITQLTGGALTAGREYDVPVYDFMFSAVANSSLSRLHN